MIHGLEQELEFGVVSEETLGKVAFMNDVIIDNQDKSFARR